MFNKTFTSILFFFALFVALTQAIVINPKITTPNSGTKWRAGQTYTVKWDTTYNDGSKNVPIPSTSTGTIKLGYLEAGDEYNEHLVFGDLASGFKLDAGSVSITLPATLTTKNTYIIVLMGDSGNASQKFKISSSK